MVIAADFFFKSIRNKKKLKKNICKRMLVAQNLLRDASILYLIAEITFLIRFIGICTEQFLLESCFKQCSEHL